jgi:hypothetical protein
MNLEDSFRLEPHIAGDAHHYSEFGMDYTALRRQHWFSSVDAPCSELDGDFHFLDAEFSDLPPLLEPAYIPSVIPSFLEGAVGKEKGQEDYVENENENGEGRALEKGKGRAKGKGKARISPYPRERPHLRAEWQPLFAGSFLMNTGACSNITTSNMLAEFRNHPLLFSEGHFSGDPSGCGVPHHDN